MVLKLPGTTIQAKVSGIEEVDALFSSMFLGGGLMLSQVSQVTGLEPYRIQNWVKRGFLSPPEKKRYTRRQLSRILVINMLKDSLQLERICGLLSYVNGKLYDEGDDIIDDSKLYLDIVRVLLRLETQVPLGAGDLEPMCREVLADYQEPEPGDRERVLEALQIILMAYLSAQLKHGAEARLSALVEQNGEEGTEK